MDIVLQMAGALFWPEQEEKLAPLQLAEPISAR
jgi:hypothetical protein